ncbi:MAG: hypothetical protein JXR03_19595 [Cyclobacteriaceae bacterium]
MKYCFILVLFFFGAFAVNAQTTRDVAPTPPKPAYRSEKDEKFSIFKKKKSDKDDEVTQFRKRMKKVSKKNLKNEKLAQKPQYSDPLYFGHKKPPKKRKNGKKKFCKECGLSH